MNYIMEIRLFYDRLEVAPLPPMAIALWHGLIYLSNKSGWPPEISIPISTLEARSGLERRSVYRARDILRDVGLIDFRERAGNQCALYKLISLADLLYNSDTQSVTQTDAPEPEDGENAGDCCTDLSRNPAHKEGVLYENDTQSVTQTEPCCTDLSHSVSPLDRPNISIEDKKINKGGSGGNKKKDKTPKPKNPPFDLSFIGDEVWESLVRTWLDYKRSRNESYKSDLSVKKFHTMLRNLSGGDPAVAGKIIDKSIARNWAGIFELTDDPAKPKGQAATGQRIGQIKQPEDEERRRKLLNKFGSGKK